MADITVIGSINMDIVAQVTQFPKAGQTIMGKSIATFPGGKGANQCVAAARLGAEVEMIGAVGCDAYGKSMLELFENERVICKNVLVLSDTSTSTAIIQINESGENNIVVIPSANFKFELSSIKNLEHIIKTTKLVMLQLELKLEVVEQIAKMCIEFGVPLLLNPAPAYELSQSLLSSATYLTPNETELEILSGIKIDSNESILNAAQKMLKLGVKNVIATLGKRGALIANSEGVKIVDGFKVSAVDTVAAGDCFNGALAKAIVDGKKLEDAIRFANAAAALAVTKKGAIPSLPTFDEVKHFLSFQ